MVGLDWYYGSAIFFMMMGGAITAGYYGGMFDDAVRSAEYKNSDKAKQNKPAYGSEEKIKRVQVSNDPKDIKAQSQAVS